MFSDVVPASISTTSVLDISVYGHSGLWHSWYVEYWPEAVVVLIG